MNAARTGGGKANSEPAGELRVAAGHECSCFLVPHLDEPNFLLALPQRLHDAVDPIAWDSEDSVHSPVDQALDQEVSSGGCHGLPKAECPEVNAPL